MFINMEEYEKRVSLDGFLDAAQQFREEFKEDIEKEKKDYLEIKGNYN